jgi:hypothetical protein
MLLPQVVSHLMEEAVRQEDTETILAYVFLLR